MTPSISIIIPVYNVQNHIATTLNSLLTQSADERLEIIVIDDGSTDDTVKVAQEVFASMNSIDYRIISKENGGVSSARNAGLAEALGDYVMFLDGDDYVASDLIKEAGSSFEGEPDIVCWGYDTVREDQTVISGYFDRYDSSSGSMSGAEALKKIVCDRSMQVWTGSAAYKKDFLQEHGLKYTEGCASGEDREFIYKALSKAKRLFFVDKTLSYYVQRDDSISNSYNIRRFDSIGAMKRTYEYIYMGAANDELKIIANIFKNQNMIENYLYNLKSCFCNSEPGCGIGCILQEIDMHYPRLNEEMVASMKSYSGDSFKMMVKVRIFLISPKLYFGLVRLRCGFKIAPKER